MASVVEVVVVVIRGESDIPSKGKATRQTCRASAGKPPAQGDPCNRKDWSSLICLPLHGLVVRRLALRPPLVLCGLVLHGLDVRRLALPALHGLVAH